MKVRSAVAAMVSAAVCAAVVAAGAMAQSVEQDRARMERQTVDWFKAINAEGPNSRLATGVAESIRSALAGGRHAHVLVPPACSRDGKPHLAMTYAGVLHRYVLTPEQAAQLELTGDGVIVQEGSKRLDIRGLNLVAQVEDLRIDNAANLTTQEQITGSVAIRMIGDLNPDMKLRVAYKRTGSTVTMTRTIKEIPASGVLTFSISRIDDEDDKPHKGPLPLFVDIIQDNSLFGDEFEDPDTVVSNTLSALLDVRSAPSIAGTTWRFGGGDSTVTFLDNGEVDFSDTTAGGKWRLEGDSLSFDCNDFTLFEVKVAGDTMTGTWRRLKGEDVGFKAPTSLTRLASR